MTASPNDTVVRAGSTGAITDAAGNRWTISSSNSVLENGKAPAFSSNVAEIAYVSQTVWQENTSNQWYRWTGSGWSASNDPLPVPTPTPTPNPTPTPTPAPTPTPTGSPNDTVVRAGSTGAITDAAGNRWTISSTNAVLENGKAAAYSANVTEIAYVSKTVWQENTSNQWYSWTGSGWNAGNDPLPVPTPNPNSNPHTNADTDTTPHPNPDRVAQRHRRARRFERRDH